MLVRKIALLVFIWSFAVGDIYLHNPRGSNNRADESNRERREDQRLFDSENNDRGGHNVGPRSGAMYFYGGSKLKIEWANQHSCGDENNNCQVLIQYMCDENLRDGTLVRIPPRTCTGDCDANEGYGHHESLNYYEACELRERNHGIFTADQNLRNRHTAKYTRQNRNGKQHGYECPEERDYYPYFGHSPWKDIAIMTNDEELCKLVREHSQNVKSRWICTFSDDDWDAIRGKVLKKRRTTPTLTLNETTCIQNRLTIDNKEYQPIWKEIPSHGLPPPECIKEQFSRDNHQGNTIGGEFLSYFWSLPNIDAESCAIRIRYNISTNDFEAWSTDHTKNVNSQKGALGPEEIYEIYEFESNEVVKDREYYLKTNPEVDVFNLRDRPKKFTLKLALNTAQYGRTFQDRSHAFGIKLRPSDIDDKSVIHNLNVRGKRGNIVQVFPSTEYDFVPNVLKTKTTDYLHVQWTGSNNNNRNNAGQGKAGTDRSNIVQLGLRPYQEGTQSSLLTLGTNYPIKYPCDQDIFGLDYESRARLALAGDYKVGDTPGETLDNGDPYFDFGLFPTKTVGKHYFFSTRNNAFTNRDQKAEVTTTK